MSSSGFAALCSAFGRYDVVHIHAEGPAFFAWLPKLLGKRVVVTIHGICTMAKIGGLYETVQAILRIVMAICISMIAEKMRDMDHATTNLKNI